MPGDTGDPWGEDYYSPEHLAKVNMSIIDKMAYRILYQMISVNGPLFDSPVCDNQKLGSCNKFLYDTVATSEEHRQLARKIARESAVLLKNDDATLPIVSRTRRISRSLSLAALAIRSTIQAK
jgi:beta-glucosidase-like glycosyl hydrolase